MKVFTFSTLFDYILFAFYSMLNSICHCAAAALQSPNASVPSDAPVDESPNTDKRSMQNYTSEQLMLLFIALLILLIFSLLRVVVQPHGVPRLSLKLHICRPLARIVACICAHFSKPEQPVVDALPLHQPRTALPRIEVDGSPTPPPLAHNPHNPRRASLQSPGPSPTEDVSPSTSRVSLALSDAPTCWSDESNATTLVRPTVPRRDHF